MKKLRTLVMVLSVFALGVAKAYAVPTIDGAITTATEWANVNFGSGPYPYYLEVNDPNESDNIIDNMDISHGVLLQELSNFGGTPSFTDDGLYLLLEVYAPPPSLAFATGPGVVPTTQPVIRLAGDLLGNGLNDGFNIFLRHYNTDPSTGLVANDIVDVCVGSLASCNSIGSVYTNLVTAGGSFGRGSVIEYFIPSGTFGTPPSPPGTPFPLNFVGQLTYDNGASGPNTADDVVIGSLAVPEPGTFFLLGSALLSLLGFGKFRKM